MAFREDGFATAAGATICRAGARKSPRQQSKTLNAVEIEEAISALAGATLRYEGSVADQQHTRFCREGSFLEDTTPVPTSMTAHKQRAGSEARGGRGLGGKQKESSIYLLGHLRGVHAWPPL